MGYDYPEASLHEYNTSTIPSASSSSSLTPNPVKAETSNIQIQIESEEPDLTLEHECETSISIREELVEPILSWDGDKLLDLHQPEVTESQREEFAVESWEDELDEQVGVQEKNEALGWEELHQEVKNKLVQVKRKHLTLSKTNQLLIIQNFYSELCDPLVEKVWMNAYQPGNCIAVA